MAQRVPVQNPIADTVVRPTAQGLGNVSGALGPIPGPSGLAGLAQFSQALQRLTQTYARNRKDEMRATARAQVQQAAPIVDVLVRETVGVDDPIEARERVARAMRRAQAAGIIKTADDPFFRTELLVALGERLGDGVRRRVMTRQEKGDHLSRDLGNGDVELGTPIDTIWNEEVARSSTAAILESGLASRAFAQALERSRPAVVEAARRAESDNEVRRLTGIREGQITESAAAAGMGGPEEREEHFGELQKHIDELYASNIPDARERTISALVDGAEYVALTDPDRARHMLSMAGQEIQVLGRSLDEDPVIAVALDQARIGLTEREQAHSATAAGRVESRRKERVQELEEKLGRSVTEFIDGGASPLAARDAAVRELRAALKNDPDRGSLLEPLVQHVEALVSDGTTDTILLDTFQGQIDLAETSADLDLIEGSMEVYAGDGLYGRHLAELKRSLRDRRTSLGGDALAADQTYNTARNRLEKWSAPDALPADERADTDSALDRLRREFTNRAIGLVNENGGKAPFIQMSELADTYNSKARELVAEAAKSNAELVAEAEAAAERGDRGVVSRYEGLIGPERLSRISSRSLEVAFQKQRLESSEDIRRMQYELSTYLEIAAGDELTTQAKAALLQQTSTKFRATVREAIDSAPPGTDFVDLHQRAVEAARAFADEARAERPDAIAAAVAARAEEGATSTTLLEIQEDLLRAQADKGYAAQYTSGRDPLAFSATTHQELRTYLPRNLLDQVGEIQESAYGRGFFSTNRTNEEARAALSANLRLRLTPQYLKQSDLVSKEVVATFAPLGLSVDEFMSGSLTLPPVPKDVAKAGTRVPTQRQLRTIAPDVDFDAEVEVKFDAADVPPWSTTFFETEAQLRAFKEDPREPKFFEKLGIVSDDEQNEWVRQQIRNIDRLNATRTR